MDFYEDAVELALDLDKDCNVAKSVAKDFEAKAKHRTKKEKIKKIWLMIAKYLVTSNDDPQPALRLIQDCKHLSIEDILPYLEGFSSLGNFKDLIIKSLQKYQTDIQNYKN
eukprot:UN33114